MAFRQSRQILAGYPVLHARSAEGAVLIRADFVVPTGGLLVGDIIEMCGLAEGLVPTDVKGIFEDLDTGAAITIDCGILSGPYAGLLNADGSPRTMGNEFFAAATTGQAGGVMEANKSAGYLLIGSSDVVSIGFKIVAAPVGQIVGARLRIQVEASALPVSMS